MFTDCVEPIFNAHPRVARCALVGIGQKPRQTPVIVVELETETATDTLPSAVWKKSPLPLGELCKLALANANTRTIDRFLFYPVSLPVDVRHNTKINREQLAKWAARQ